MAAPRDGDPSQVGPYRSKGRPGAGGMGQVFLGRSPGRRLVAVKLIRPELADDTSFRRRASTAKEASEVTTPAHFGGERYVQEMEPEEQNEDQALMPVMSVQLIRSRWSLRGTLGAPSR